MTGKIPYSPDYRVCAAMRVLTVDCEFYVHAASVLLNYAAGKGRITMRSPMLGGAIARPRPVELRRLQSFQNRRFDKRMFSQSSKGQD